MGFYKQHRIGDSKVGCTLEFLLKGFEWFVDHTEVIVTD